MSLSILMTQQMRQLFRRQLIFVSELANPSEQGRPAPKDYG